MTRWKAGMMTGLCIYVYSFIWLMLVLVNDKLNGYVARYCWSGIFVTTAVIVGHFCHRYFRGYEEP